MADKTIYEAFQDEFKTYAELSGYVKEAREEYHISGKGRKTLADLSTDPLVKDLAKTTNDADQFGNAMAIHANAGKSKLEEMTNSPAKVEGLIDNMSNEDLLLALAIVPPKDSYSGSKAKVYEEISKARKELAELKVLEESGDGNAIKKKIEDKYVPQMTDIDKQVYEALGGLNNQIIHKYFAAINQEAQKNYTDKMKNNEKGYLAASLEGISFLDFYGALDEKRNQLEMENKRQRRNNGARIK